MLAAETGGSLAPLQHCRPEARAQPEPAYHYLLSCWNLGWSQSTLTCYQARTGDKKLIPLSLIYFLLMYLMSCIGENEICSFMVRFTEYPYNHEGI